MQPFKISLAAALVNAGMTQKEFAKACLVSEGTVFNWEAGKSVPTVDRIPAIEKALGITADHIDFRRK